MGNCYPKMLTKSHHISPNTHTFTNLIFTLGQESLLKLQEKSYSDIIHLAVLIGFAAKRIVILFQEEL